MPTPGRGAARIASRSSRPQRSSGRTSTCVPYCPSSPAKGHGSGRPPAVVQPPRGAPAGHGGDHRQQRRDPDSPGEEQVLRVFPELKVVARSPHLQHVTRPQDVVDVRRAAPGPFLPQDRDPVAEPVGGIAAERVLTHRVAHHHVNVGPGRPGGQHAPERVGQHQRQDPVGLQRAFARPAGRAPRPPRRRRRRPIQLSYSCPYYVPFIERQSISRDAIPANVTG